MINTDAVMFELADCIKLAVAADEVNLYLVENEGELTKYSPVKGKKRPVYQIGEGTTIAAYTASVRQEVRVVRKSVSSTFFQLEFR